MKHWTLDDIPWERFDRSRVDPEVVKIVKAAGTRDIIDAVVENGVWTRQEPVFESPINLGAHCAKGASIREHGMTHDSHRLKYPMKLVDGKYHDTDSSEIAFKIAGSMAFKSAYEQADPVLLEPIMELEVTAPDEAVGAVNGDLNSRRGRLHLEVVLTLPGPAA